MPEINLTSDAASPEDGGFITQLIRGVGGESETEYKQSCEARGGKLSGLGPECEKGEEGAKALTLCLFDATELCIQKLASGMREACSLWLEGVFVEARLGDDAPTVPDNPCSSQIKNQRLDEQYYDGANIVGIDSIALDVSESTATGGDDGQQMNSPEPEKTETTGPVGDVVTQKKDAECTAYQAIYTYNLCMKRADEQCGCQTCVIGLTIHDEDDSANEDDVPADETTSDDPDNETSTNNLLNLRTTSNFGFIPKIIGRYVVGGNVLWLGNKETREIPYRQTNSEGVSTNVTTFVTTVDMVVGISAGEMGGLLRMWVGDLLVYTRLLELDLTGEVDLTNGSTGFSDLDLSLFAGDELSTAHVQNVAPEVRFVRGTESQKLPVEVLGEIAFGRYPAHRGLSYVVIKGLDISLFSTTVPEIRFDVQSALAPDDAPKVVSDVLTIDADYLEWDKRTNLLYTRDGNDLVLFNADTLEESYRTALPASTDAITLLRSGNAVCKDGTAVSILDPFRGRVDATGVINTLGVGYDTFSAIEEFARTEYELLLAPQANTSFELLKYNYNDAIFETVRNITGDAGLATGGGLFINVFGRGFYIELALPTPTQTELKVQRYRLKEEDGFLADVVGLSRYTIPASVWGGQTTGVSIKHVIHDTKDNGIVVIFAVAGGDVTAAKLKFSLDMTSIAVDWSVVLDIPLPSALPLKHSKVHLTNYFYYANDDGDVARLELSKGTLELRGTLAGFGLPEVAGVQLFDDVTNSITYLSMDGTLVRAFFDRLSPQLASMSEALDYVVSKTRFPIERFDSSAVDDIEFVGLIIDTQITAAAFINQFTELFQFSIVDDGEKLYALKESSFTGDVVALDDNFIILDDVQTSRLVTDLSNQSIGIEFFRLSSIGMQKVRQLVSLDPEDESLDVAATTIAVKMIDSEAAMRARAEQVLRIRRAKQNVFATMLMPRYLGLTPRDRVSYGGYEYIINLLGSGADLSTALAGRLIDQEAYDANVDVQAIYLASSNIVARPPRGEPPYRPVALFLPNVINEQSAKSLTGPQLIYVGLDVPDRTTFTPTSYKMYMVQGPDVPPDPYNGVTDQEATPASPLYRTQTLFEGTHSGRLVTPPASLVTGIYETDDTSAMVIKFDHPDTVDYFVATAGLYDIQESPTSNLLIVGAEFIQFKNWSVAMDGLTVTFNTLFRGGFGTDNLVGEHFVDQRVYFYTRDSLRPMLVDPKYTKFQQAARMFFRDGNAPVGAQSLDYSIRSDAGACRPPAPTNFVRYGTTYYPGPAESIQFDYKFRRPFMFNFLENGGDVPYDFADGSDLVFHLRNAPSHDSFNVNVVRAYDEPTIRQNYAYDIYSSGDIGFPNNTTLDPLTDPLTFAVCYTTLHPTAGLIVGFPAFVTFYPGAYP